jgi:hypothetical protein
VSDPTRDNDSLGLDKPVLLVREGTVPDCLQRRCAQLDKGWLVSCVRLVVLLDVLPAAGKIRGMGERLAFVCNGGPKPLGDPDIGRKLKEALQQVDAKLPMIVDDPDPYVRGAAIWRADGLALADGHWDNWGVIDELALGGRAACRGICARVLIVGCCWSGTSRFMHAVRGGLDRPVVYVGYTGKTPNKDAGLVFPGLVGGLLEHGLDDEPESLEAVAARCLEMVRNQYPAESNRLRGWKASVLRPIQQLRAA